MKPNRREFLRSAGAAAGLALVPGLAAGRAPRDDRPDKPNVLFVLTDQWRAQALGCAGDPNVKTPRIDGMARSGVRFTHCFSNSPVCSPYRSMLMTGRYTARNGVWQNNILLPPEETCIAETFADAGYATGYIGKWHLDGPPKPGRVKHRQGWKYWAGFNRGHAYFKGRYFTDAEKAVHVPEGIFEPDHQTGLALDFMRERAAGEEPWFLMVSYGGPHMPYKAPDEYMERYDPDKLKLRKNSAGITEKGRKALAGYYAHATNLDMNIGRLLDGLDELDLTQGTLVMFTSDHGDMHFSQGAQYKSKPWEESIGVPLVARMPGTIPRGREEDALFSSIDFFPTLCGLCGMEQPADRDGADLSHLLLGKSGPRRESVHLTIGKPDAEKAWRGVRTERHTYAWHPNRDEGYVLYDNKSDPYQMNNLIEDEKHAPLRERLHALTLRNLREAGDPLGDR